MNIVSVKYFVCCEYCGFCNDVNERDYNFYRNAE